MSTCTDACCPLVQIRPRGGSIFEPGKAHLWSMWWRKRISSGARARSRRDGYIRQLPAILGYGDPLARIESERLAALGSRVELQECHDTIGRTCIRTPPRAGDEWLEGVGGAWDEHSGVCEWPPRRWDALDAAGAAIEAAFPSGEAGILDLDGLTTTPVVEPVSGLSVSSPAGRKALAAGRGRWTRAHGHKRSLPELTDREISQYHAGRHARTMCGTHAAVFERRMPAAGVACERMAVPLMCGQRMCRDCFARSREVAGERLRGDWRQFLTLTFAHERGAMLHAWRNISKWASKMMACLRRVSKKGEEPCSCVGRGKVADHPAVRVEGDRLAFGWVIEPHGTMWPHVHVCINTSWICFDWIRKAWARVTREVVQMVKAIPVYDCNGICRYLVKYLTKADFPDVLLAVLFRKRLWGRSDRPKIEHKKGWSMVDVLPIPKRDGERSLDDVVIDNADSCVAIRSGRWRVTGRLNGRWIQWTISDRPEDGSDESGGRLCEWQPKSYLGRPVTSTDCFRRSLREVADLVDNLQRKKITVDLDGRLWSPGGQTKLDSTGATRVTRVGSDPEWPWDVPEWPKGE